jgi:hypothetical protein
MNNMNIIETNHAYKLLQPIKGWPVEDSVSLEEATQLILGSPYWNIPEDTYLVIDKNETYCLLAVYHNHRMNPENHYLAVKIKTEEFLVPAIDEDTI